MENNNNIHYNPGPKTKVNFAKTSNSSYINRSTSIGSFNNNKRNKLAQKYGLKPGFRRNSDVSVMSDYTNDYNYNYNNDYGPSFGQVRSRSSRDRSNKNTPFQRQNQKPRKKSRNNIVVERSKPLPSTTEKTKRNKKTATVYPLSIEMPQNVRMKQTKTQNWGVTKAYKELNKVKLELNNVLKLVENTKNKLQSQLHQKGKRSSSRTKKNLTPGEINIGTEKIVNQLTTIIVNLESNIPSAPTEQPPERPPQENNNSLNSFD